MTMICRTCDEEYPEFGDGWDGECPSCADVTYAAEEARDHPDRDGPDDDSWYQSALERAAGPPRNTQ